jgi:hypothetical protein
MTRKPSQDDKAPDEKTPAEAAGSDTPEAKRAAEAQPSTPPTQRAPDESNEAGPGLSADEARAVRRDTALRTTGQVARATEPALDAGGTPVVPNGPPADPLAAVGDYPRTYAEAVEYERRRETADERQDNDEDSKRDRDSVNPAEDV